MRKGTMYACIGIFAMAIVGYVIWRTPQPDSGDTLQQRPPPIEVNGLPDSEMPQPRSAESPAGRDLPESVTKGEAPTQQAASDVGVTLPHDMSKGDYKKRLLEEIESNPPELRDSSDPELDADTAYRIYLYEAYLMMSYALLQGVIYPKDLVMALAYMRVAEKKAAQHQIAMAMYPSLLNTIEQNMTPKEIADADKLALELQLEAEH